MPGAGDILPRGMGEEMALVGALCAVGGADTAGSQECPHCSSAARASQ